MKNNKGNRPKPQEIIFGDYDDIRENVESLISKHHTELAMAKFKFICRSKASAKAGKPLLGNVYKMSGKFKHLVGCDFVIEIAIDCWNNLTGNQRTAFLDHLLSRCVGVEDPQNGEMKWNIRPPEIQEFPEVAERHGCWNEGLAEMRLCLVNR